MSRIKLIQGDANFCFEVVEADGEQAELTFVQSDWEYAGLAVSFGWSLQALQKCEHCGKAAAVPVSRHAKYKCPGCGKRSRRCDHDASDGTVPCRACGLTAGEFLGEAWEYLNANDGKVVESDDFDDVPITLSPRDEEEE